MRRMWIVTNGSQFAGIGFTWMSTMHAHLAKPYFSEWRARFRAWRMNRSDERDHVGYYTAELPRWRVEEVEFDR